jgi:hypothetical protein
LLLIIGVPQNPHPELVEGSRILLARCDGPDPSTGSG